MYYHAKIVDDGELGSPTKTGIHPFLYSAPGCEHDDFYFSDFYIPIHKDHEFGQAVRIANHIENARYPDGRYTGTRI